LDVLECAAAGTNIKTLYLPLLSFLLHYFKSIFLKKTIERVHVSSATRGLKHYSLKPISCPILFHPTVTQKFGKDALITAAREDESSNGMFPVL
jgi:hypothetical protein